MTKARELSEFGSVLDVTNGNVTFRSSQRVVSASATSGNLTVNSDITDLYVAGGLTGSITFLAPTGIPSNGQKLIIRIKDDGTPRTISWTTGSTGAFRVIGVTLPTTTVANKSIYVGCMYNTVDSRWDVVALTQEA